MCRWSTCPSWPPARRPRTRSTSWSQAAAEGPLKGILGINKKPLVSVDFNHDARSSVYDATLTKVMGGTLVKVCAWYDNEWGFSNRMLDTALAMMKV
jgi:glyceraldehyde 3-phosphate dehydrogenase